jgi:tetratricopeptide (TPR) repeat protein
MPPWFTIKETANCAGIGHGDDGEHLSLIIRSLKLRGVLVGCLLAVISTTVRAQTDRIKLRSDPKTLIGSVDSVSKNDVVVTAPSGVRTIPVSDVDSIVFGGVPVGLEKAQAALAKGEYKAAADDIAEIAPTDITRDIPRAELAFIKALCPAKIALSGQADSAEPAAEARAAGAAMLAFLKDYPGSYHFFEANEIVGDLLMSLGQYEKAEAYYKVLGEAASPDTKARANLLLGRAMQNQGKYDAALDAYDLVLKANLTGKVGDQETVEAKIGRTYSLTSSGKVDEAVKILQEIIAKADDDDSELLARAYNALGNCYRKLKDDKQALFAYLRVDTVYNTVAEPHAEALANLVSLWNEAKHPERAREARDKLRDRYPFSRWNKQIR